MCQSIPSGAFVRRRLNGKNTVRYGKAGKRLLGYGKMWSAILCIDGKKRLCGIFFGNAQCIALVFP